VSALLLDDALLQCVVFRSRLVFNSCFEDTDISQDSVATHLRCGGIFSDSIITKLFWCEHWNKFENWSRSTNKCTNF